MSTSSCAINPISLTFPDRRYLISEKPKLKIIPLGGLGEIGKNMMVMEYDGRMLIIDAGFSFPKDELLGIDLVIPDFSYVRERAGQVEAVLLTHGHEDHVGALPFFLREINVPVYGTRLTLGLVGNKLEEHGLAGTIDLREIVAGTPQKIGPFHCEFISVTHSIPDGVAVAVKTPVGAVVHTGDFKLDPNPIDKRRTDMGKFGELGNEGVLLLLSDSTNAEVEGVTGPENSVRKTLEETARGRPMSLFRREDFPTLGRPTRATRISPSSLSSWRGVGVSTLKTPSIKSATPLPCSAEMEYSAGTPS